jgi:hypothetical protein
MFLMNKDTEKEPNKQISTKKLQFWNISFMELKFQLIRRSR